MQLTLNRFEKFYIAARASDTLRRIAKVMFARDGSVYIFFSGFAKTHGIVSRVHLRAGAAAQSKISLEDHGRVTAHFVKYAHHPDGEAHFSQDGKVVTEIRRRSVPLKQQIGHIFSIYIQGIESFQRLEASKEGRLTIDLPDRLQALKITGWRFPLAAIDLPHGVNEICSPVSITTRDGITRVGLVVAPPAGALFEETILFLAFDEVPWVSADKKELLLFLGGFDPSRIALNHALDMEFLAFTYPCEDFAELLGRIGSIDLMPGGSS